MDNFLRTTSPTNVYRIDKFRVPDAAYPEFLARVRDTHEFLRTLPGFVEDRVLEQTGGPGVFNFVTIVVWENAEAIAAAKGAVMERFRATGFDPPTLFARLGIEADLANYEAIDGEAVDEAAVPAGELEKLSSS